MIISTYAMVISCILLTCQPFHHFWQINPDPGSMSTFPGFETLLTNYRLVSACLVEVVYLYHRQPQHCHRCLPTRYSDPHALGSSYSKSQKVWTAAAILGCRLCYRGWIIAMLPYPPCKCSHLLSKIPSCSILTSTRTHKQALSKALHGLFENPSSLS